MADNMADASAALLFSAECCGPDSNLEVVNVAKEVWKHNYGATGYNKKGSRLRLLLRFLLFKNN